MTCRQLIYLVPVRLAISLTGGRPTAASPDRHCSTPQSPASHYLEYGGIGLLVYDMDDCTGWCAFPRSAGAGIPPEKREGIAANAQTGRIYVSTIRSSPRSICSPNNGLEPDYEGGADRIALSPDGKILYVPRRGAPLARGPTR